MQFNANKPLSDPLIANIFDFAGEHVLIPSAAVNRAFRDRVKEIWNKKVTKLCQQPVFLRTFGKIELIVYQQRPLAFLRAIFMLSCGAKERRATTHQAIEVQARNCVKASCLASETQKQIKQEWALNLLALFEEVAFQCQAAQDFLDSLKDQSLTEKAENIFLWLQEKTNQAKIETIKELNISYRSLTNLPYEIGLFKGLEILNLVGNNLVSLPATIGSLVNLEVLDLDKNQLKTLPGSIGSLVKLDRLSLDFNQLTALPDSIGSLVNLKGLYLYKNQLTSLPGSIGLLINLQQLFLRFNQLTGLPASIESLVNLKKLDLRNNPLKSDSQIHADYKIIR